MKLLEELTQLSPGVSPPHSSATSPSHSSSPMKTRKIKETFVLNPFKGKEAGTVKKLDAAPKVCKVIEFYRKPLRHVNQ